jgi:hypothetical protein
VKSNSLDKQFQHLRIFLDELALHHNQNLYVEIRDKVDNHVLELREFLKDLVHPSFSSLLQYIHIPRNKQQKKFYFDPKRIRVYMNNRISEHKKRLN